MEIGSDEDHVHFLVQSVPVLSPSRVVHVIKSITAKEIFKQHPEVKKLLWGGKFWRSGFRPPPVAIDLPYSKHGGDIARDEWIAQSILKIFRGNPSAKMIVIVGGLYTLKKLEWEPHVPNNNKSIREYITKENPEIRMYSVGEMIQGNPDECDFTKRFSSLPGAIALDLDDRYRGWKLGLTATLAIIPAECFELVDGLIVYSCWMITYENIMDLTISWRIDMVCN